MNILAAGSIAVLFACTTGCGSACDQAGCPDAILIEFVDSATWEAGSYTLTVNGEKSCSLDVGSSRKVSGERSEQENAGGHGGANDSSAIGCSGSGVLLSNAGGGPLTLSVERPLEQFELTIERDGLQLLSETIRPEYSRLPTRKTSCGEGCLNARVEMQVE